MTKREWTLAGLSAGAMLLISLIVMHVRDRGRDAALVRAHQTIAADSTMRRAAVATTTAAAAVLDTSTAAAARVDTVWRKTVATSSARIDTIVLSTKPDTVKIRELVRVDSTLIVAGNALADTTQQLRAAAVNFQATVIDERAAWTKERSDQAAALAISEAQHRHWGLGITAGAAAVRSPDGTVHVGPGVTVGITFRW